jgi:ficolin
MADFRGEKKYAYYNFFMVGNADSNYKLQVASYSGTAGDSLTQGTNLNGMPFSTRDRDNDPYTTVNCAENYKGGWWYNNCMQAQLNGIYRHNTATRGWMAVIWGTITSSSRSLKFAEMKLIRDRD